MLGINLLYRIDQILSRRIHALPAGNHLICPKITENMTESLKAVSSGEITYAVRDTTIDGREIHSGDILFLGDNGLLSAEKDILSAVREALPKMGEGEILSLYYGEDVKAEDAEALVSEIQKDNPELEIELQNGGQAVYYYLLSLE